MLLSTTTLASIGKSTRVSAEVFSAKKGATQISVSPVIALKGSKTTLVATLTSAGSPLIGKSVRFQVRGRNVGKATTNAQGTATLSNVKLKGVFAGAYAAGILAKSTGNANLKPGNGRGSLTVSRASSSLSNVAAGGFYGGNGSFTATLSSKGTPASGQTVTFFRSGVRIGDAVTNDQGIASLDSVNLASAMGGVQPNAVTATYAGSVDFGPSSASGVLNLSPLPVTISLSGLSKTYNGSTQLATVTTNANNAAYTVAYTDSNGHAVANPTAAGSYNVTATLTGPNYSGSTTGTLVIAKAAVTTTGITANNKVYDGTTAATLNTSSAALSGVISGDNVTLNIGAASGAFASKTVGQTKTVTVSGLTLSGTAAANYTLTQPTASANITAATLTVSGVTANNKVYDSTTTATLNTTSAALVGVVSGDQVTLGTATAAGAFLSVAVGTGKSVTVSGLTITGTDAANYTLVQPTATANITPATVTITGVTASDKVYDGTTVATINTTNATAAGFISGDNVVLDVSAATGSFDTKDVGTGKTVTLSGFALTGTAAGNYVITQPTTTANVTAAPLTVTGITAENKPYDGNTNATLDTTNAALDGVISGDTVTLDVSNAVGTFDTPDIGVDKTVTISGLTIGGTDSGNYSLTQPTTTASIT